MRARWRTVPLSAQDSSEASTKSGFKMAADFRCDTSAVARWLVQGARSAGQPADVLKQLCEQLVTCGIPLWRVSVFVRTLHPHVMGRRFSWQLDTGVSISEAGYERLDDDIYRMSPVVHVYNSAIARDRRRAAGHPRRRSLLARARHRALPFGGDRFGRRPADRTRPSEVQWLAGTQGTINSRNRAVKSEANQ